MAEGPCVDWARRKRANMVITIAAADIDGVLSPAK